MNAFCATPMLLLMLTVGSVCHATPQDASVGSSYNLLFVDADSRNPIPGVTVEIYDVVYLPGARNVFVQGSGFMTTDVGYRSSRRVDFARRVGEGTSVLSFRGHIRTIVGDRGGKATVELPPRGRSLRISHGDYAPYEWLAIPEKHRSLVHANQVGVIPLWKARSLRRRIVASDGKGISRVTIALLGQQDMPWKATSDEQGYLEARVGQGPWQVAVARPGWELVKPKSGVLKPTDPSDIVLRRLPCVQVLDERSGEPIQFFTLSVSANSRQLIDRAVWTFDGLANITKFPMADGTARVTLSASGFESLTTTVNLFPSAPHTIKLQREGRVSKGSERQASPDTVDAEEPLILLAPSLLSQYAHWQFRTSLAEEWKSVPADGQINHPAWGLTEKVTLRADSGLTIVCSLDGRFSPEGSAPLRVEPGLCARVLDETRKPIVGSKVTAAHHPFFVETRSDSAGEFCLPTIQCGEISVGDTLFLVPNRDRTPRKALELVRRSLEEEVEISGTVTGWTSCAEGLTGPKAVTPGVRIVVA